MQKVSFAKSRINFPFLDGIHANASETQASIGTEITIEELQSISDAIRMLLLD